MSIDDDIFDVADVQHPDTVDAFNRLVEYICALEAESEKLRDENSVLRRAIKLVEDG